MTIKDYDDYLIDRLADAEVDVDKASQRVQSAAQSLSEATIALGEAVKVRDKTAEDLVNWRALDQSLDYGRP